MMVRLAIRNVIDTTSTQPFYPYYSIGLNVPTIEIEEKRSKLSIRAHIKLPLTPQM